MVSPHLLKLRFRRFWRRWLARSLNFFHVSGETFEKNGVSRLTRLRAVWRFVTVWLLAAVLIGIGLLIQLATLRSYYQVYGPVPGGRFVEGIAGAFTTANPLYAVNDIDTSVARLLFDGLLTYDDQNQLVGDLAESWNVDPTGRIYTIRLRPNLVWHDGKPVTADDVVYTYRTIQNPDAQSPLGDSWHGVQVAAVDDRIVTFTLPNPLSSFPTSLTNGIVPKHILQSVDPVDLRSVGFNTVNPVGTGPFRWGAIGISGIGETAETQVSLLPNERYWAGAPKLTSFTLDAFGDQQAMIEAYKNQQLTAIAGLDSLPSGLQYSSSQTAYHLPLTAGVYAFFKTSAPVFKDVKVRQALTLAVDRTAVVRAIGYPTQAIDEPLLPEQLGYDPAYRQTAGDPAQAAALLEAAGWHADATGKRSKDGQPLVFTLLFADTPEYSRVSRLLTRAWAAVGASVQIVSPATADFQFQLSSHTYDALLYGITIGADPDVFVYWDSSQNDARAATHLNFSEYASATADLSLEAGRTRADPALRVAKYRSFLQAWQQDNPALGLYQPRFLYLSHTKIYGLSDQAPLNSDADRFRNVQNWMLNLGWATR